MLTRDRDRWLDWIVGHSVRRVTVRGPAGSGKTVLLAQWAATMDGAVGWATVADADNDLGAVVGDLGAAVRPSDPPVGQSGTQHRRRPEGGRHEGPVTLIVDRFECLRRARPRTPSRRYSDLTDIRPALSTRTAPVLPLSRWRLAAELSEIDADELAFTAAETIQLWHGSGSRLATLRPIAAQTEGWYARGDARASAHSVTRARAPRH